MLGEDFRPTLLVGVGGTGCSIVEDVQRQVHAASMASGGKIGVLGLDTDENDMRRIRAVERRNLIRLSTADPVYKILTDLREEVAEWCVSIDAFPAEIRTMTLLDGAAQIRMLTRLGLLNSVKRNGVDTQISDAIARLGVHDSRDVQTGLINVMLVGSIAGATGSGSFTAVALLIRELCRKRRIGSSVRGVFLLPDIYVFAASLPPDQIQNVRANAQASLKELNAINARVTRRGDYRNFEFEYAPGYGLRDDGVPFDSVTLIDFENMRGGNLGRSLDPYKKMAARAVYLQLFSPIGLRTASVTINDARAKLAAAAQGETELFSGIGVSAVVYPSDKIAHYLKCNFALENLAGDWLRLDELFYQRVRRYGEQRASGNINVRPPDPGDSYIEDLRQLAVNERHPFFREIHERMNPRVADERGEEIEKPLESTMLDELLGHAQAVFWGTPELRTIKQRPPLDASHLDNNETLPDTIRAAERVLTEGLRRAEEALREKPQDIFLAALTGADGATEAEWRPYHLQYHLIRGGAHLVQSRYFLYSLRREIRKRIAVLDPAAIRQTLYRQSNRFDPERGESPASRETPKVQQLAREAAAPPLMKRLFGNAGTFKTTYVDYFNTSIRLLRDYCDATLQIRILEYLGSEVDLLQKELSGLFAELSGLQSELAKEIALLESEHEEGRGNFDGNLFVCANRECKRVLWQNLRERTAGLRQPEEANKQLTSAVYERYRAQRRQRGEGAPADSISRLFREVIVEQFAHRAVVGEHRAVYDFSVLTAIRRESEIAKIDWIERLGHAIDVVSSQSEPFLALTPPEAGQRIMFWAIHPTIREEFGDPVRFANLFTRNQGESPLVLEEFSPKELLCMHSRVNLDLNTLSKLHPGDPLHNNVNAPAAGEYYKAYQAMVDDIIAAELVNPDAPRSRSFTPHLHRDWHRPGVLPEIFPDLDRRHTEQLYRAFLVGIGVGVLRTVIHYQRPKTVFNSTGVVMGGAVSRDVVESEDDWQILQALRRRSELVVATQAVWDALLHDESRPAGRTDDWFDGLRVVGGLVGPSASCLQRALMIAAIRKEADLRNSAVRGLVRAFAGLVWDLVEHHRGDLEPIGRRDLAFGLVEQAGRRAIAAIEAAGVRIETLEVLRTLFAQGFGEFKGSRRG